MNYDERYKAKLNAAENLASNSNFANVINQNYLNFYQKTNYIIIKCIYKNIHKFIIIYELIFIIILSRGKLNNLYL